MSLYRDEKAGRDWLGSQKTYLCETGNPPRGTEIADQPFVEVLRTPPAVYRRDAESASEVTWEG